MRSSASRKISGFLREEELTPMPQLEHGKSFGGTMELAVFGRMRNETDRRVELARRRFAQFAAPGGPWEVKDVSQTGFRLLAPMSVANMVTLGTLAAIRPHGQTPWTLGIVRRMKRMTADRAEIGLQVIANTLIGVDLVEQRKNRRRRLFGRRRGDDDQRPHVSRPLPRAAQARGRFRRAVADRSGVRIPARQAAEAHDVEVDQSDPLRPPARAAAGVGVGDRRAARHHRADAVGFSTITGEAIPPTAANE